MIVAPYSLSVTGTDSKYQLETGFRLADSLSISGITLNEKSTGWRWEITLAGRYLVYGTVGI
jgi:hypothetical protein